MSTQPDSYNFLTEKEPSVYKDAFGKKINTFSKKLVHCNPSYYTPVEWCNQLIDHNTCLIPRVMSANHTELKKTQHGSTTK